MNKENFQTFFDCGFSKIRAGTFNTKNNNKNFFSESKFFTDQLNLESKIQNIITSLEKDSDEYINTVNLMIDSPKMLSVNISFSKRLDGSKLKKTNIQFLVQEAKQQILKHYTDYNIAHIVINNYKIDNVDYSYLPEDIKCNFISLDIFFICLPEKLVLYFKDIFSKFNILINQIICSSYAKSINYKNKLNLTDYTSFVDVGFNKTSVISYYNNKILSLEVLPVGGNNITKDISKILETDLSLSENLKINFDQNNMISNDHDFSFETLQKIIFARTEEILELSFNSSGPNSYMRSPFSMVLMGEGSKILDNQYTNKISFAKVINFLEETTEDICRSGFNYLTKLNDQEVIMIPKKRIKQGFFEKLFHLFK